MPPHQDGRADVVRARQVEVEPPPPQAHFEPVEYGWLDGDIGPVAYGQIEVASLKNAMKSVETLLLNAISVYIFSFCGVRV